MILLIDNYDSFTYNLYQYIGTFNDDIKVVRNDKITILKRAGKGILCLLSDLQDGVNTGAKRS